MSVENIQSSLNAKNDKAVTIGHVNSLNEAISICLELLKQQSYEITSLKMELERNQWFNTRQQTLLQEPEVSDDWYNQNSPDANRQLADHASENLQRELECVKLAEKMREEGLTALEQAKKLQAEHETFKSSVKRQLQMLHKKELWLNKRKLRNSRPSLGKSSEIYNEFRQPGIESTLALEKNFTHGSMGVEHTLLPFDGTDIVEFDVPEFSKLEDIFLANANSLRMQLYNSVKTSATNDVEFNVVLWRIAADRDRQILENEKHYLNTISKIRCVK